VQPRLDALPFVRHLGPLPHEQIAGHIAAADVLLLPSRDEVFPVDIVVEAMDRQGLLRDISELLSREKINVTAANTLTRNLHTRMAFTIEVRSLDVLRRALALVRDVGGVLGAGRR